MCQAGWGRAVRLAVAVATVGLLAACGEGWLVSTEQEVQFGAEAHAQLTDPAQGGYEVCAACAQTQVAGGVTVTSYVTQLGQNLAALGNPDRGDATDQIPRWTFTVLQSDEVNAFALPGGFVYVTTALLGMMHNKAELAGVIGHEVGHVTNFHGVQRIESYMIVAGLSGLIFGDDAEMAEAAAGFVLTVDNLVSSQGDELEADRYGVKYAFQANWNPLEMNNFFNDILQLMGGPSDPISEVLSSHPPPEDRIAQVESESAKLGVTPDSPGLNKDDPQLPYANVKAAVAPFVPASVEGALLARIPPRLRPYVHACTFDPKTRRMVHQH